MLISISKSIKVICYSILPSPYQRDFFFELSLCPEIDLTVYYLESACSDSPWPEKLLQPYEKILPGFHLAWGNSRFHVNWHLPNIADSDVIILNGYMNITSQLLLRFEAKQKPCIFWGEKMLGTANGLKGKLQKKLAQGLNHCQAITAIGSHAALDYQHRFPNKPVFNIPYHCDLTPFQQNLPSRPRNPPTILFCGQMIARKGVDLLLKAFETLINQGLVAKLLLVGREADLPQMLSQVSAKVQTYIHYAGFHAPEQLPQFFHEADIFVLPSRYDGWGVVVNQALGAGLPLICSNAVGAAADLIEPGVNGDIFPKGDIVRLTEILATYIKNPQLISTASKASIQKSVHWSVKAGAKKWVTAIQQVLD